MTSMYERILNAIAENIECLRAVIRYSPALCGALRRSHDYGYCMSPNSIVSLLSILQSIALMLVSRIHFPSCNSQAQVQLFARTLNPQGVKVELLGRTPITCTTSLPNVNRERQRDCNLLLHKSNDLNSVFGDPMA